MTSFELNDIQFFLRFEKNILRCEKLEEIPFIYQKTAVETLKTRLLNINDVHKIETYISKRDLELVVDDLNENNIEEFVSKFQMKNIDTLFILKEDIYALLLNYAMVFNNLPLIQTIINLNFHYTNLFTVMDQIGNNSVLSMLERGNSEIINIVKNYTCSFKGPKTMITKIISKLIISAFYLGGDLSLEHFREILDPLLINVKFLESLDD